MQAKIGRIFITILTSSICCVVQCNALRTGLLATALLRNLRLFDGEATGSMALVFGSSSSSDSSSSLLIRVGGGGLVAVLAIALLELLPRQELSIAAKKTC